MQVNQGVSRLDGTRLARASAGDPFAAATNFLANRGLDDGDFIWVTGTDGTIGDVPVFFISEAGLAIPAIAELSMTGTTMAGVTNVAAGMGRSGAKAKLSSSNRSGRKRGKEAAKKSGDKPASKRSRSNR